MKTLMSVFTIPEADAGAADETPLGPDDSPVVHAGDKLHLRALLTADSAEKYVNLLHGSTMPVTEIVTMTWYTTAGSLDHNVTVRQLSFQ